MARPPSQKRAWLRFVERRRRELHDDYPCAMPTGRRLCPRHGIRVRPVTGICKPCRDELYQRLVGEYLHKRGEDRDPQAAVPRTDRGVARARELEKRRPTDDDRPPPKPFPGRKIRLLPGQMSLDDANTPERSTP